MNAPSNTKSTANTTSASAADNNPGGSTGMLSALRNVLRGAGQVMFQCNAWTGLLFLIGIYWGSYATGNPEVGWGAVVGLLSSTVAGYIMNTNESDGTEGLWGFNGILVGCAFPTFLSNTWQMWVALIFCAMITTWMRRGFNNVYTQYKINSLTFPFVFMTWLFLLASRMMHGIAPDALSIPALTETFANGLHASFGDLVIYWLKGVSQVFLVNDWITGIIFLVALAVSSRWAAIWGAVGSAVALGVSIAFGTDPNNVANGLMGFSPVLTGIAVGCTFYKVNIHSALWALAAIVATVFVQAAMDAALAPLGIPTLTGPFCVTTWLFLLPLYKLDDRSLPDHSFWKNLLKAKDAK